MRTKVNTWLHLLALLFAVACGAKSPTGPTTNPPPSAQPPQPQPLPQVITVGYLAGRVTDVGPGTPLSNALVEVISGASVGKFTLTNPAGQYTLADLTLGNNTIRVSTAAYITREIGLVLSNEATTQNIGLQTVAPHIISGTGNQVFTVPSWLSRVRVIGTFAGRCQNFVLWIDNSLIVNEILGTCSVAIGPRYEGTHLIRGGTGRTEVSTGIVWSLTEVR